MSELFDIPESKSPRLIWMERHHITTRNRVDEDGHLVMDVYHGMTRIASGDTLDEALTNAVLSLNIKLWNE